MAYPSSPIFKAVGIKSRHVNLSSETRSGRMQVRSIGAQRWAFTAKYNPMTRAEFSPVWAFVISQQGRLGAFDVVPPIISDAQGDVSGTVLAVGAHAIGDSTIAVDGMTGTLKAGDFIKFAGHSKVYMITADATAVAGAATLSIEPGLVEALSDNEAVSYDGVVFRMRLDNDVQEYGIAGYERYNFEVDLVEDL